MAINHSQTDVCGCVRPTACVDRTGGLYLVTIRRLGADCDDRVRTGQVSDRLDVAPSSVTEMFDRLAATGLLRYEKRVGVVLTDRGSAVALELEARRCAVRTFFRRRTGFDMPLEVGYRIGYVLPDEAIERLRTLVDGYRTGVLRRRQPESISARSQDRSVDLADSDIPEYVRGNTHPLTDT